MFDTLDIGASALTAQRVRMDVIAGNIANMNVTHDADGNKVPYRRRFAVLQSGMTNDRNRPGVHVKRIQLDNAEFQKRLEPGHPDAGPDGYVKYPNIDLSVEYVNAIEASRAYEANITMMEVTKSMVNSSLRLIA